MIQPDKLLRIGTRVRIHDDIETARSFTVTTDKLKRQAGVIGIIKGQVLAAPQGHVYWVSHPEDPKECARYHYDEFELVPETTRNKPVKELILKVVSSSELEQAMCDGWGITIVSKDTPLLIHEEILASGMEADMGGEYMSSSEQSFVLKRTHFLMKRTRETDRALEIAELKDKLKAADADHAEAVKQFIVRDGKIDQLNAVMAEGVASRVRLQASYTGVVQELAKLKSQLGEVRFNELMNAHENI